jgi:hypothetical protein
MDERPGAFRSPILGPIILDLSVLLERDTQPLLAAWCLKTVMVYQCTARSLFYSKAERQRFAETLEVPRSDTVIWLGRHNAEAAAFAEAIELRTTPPPSDADGYVTTLAFHHLVLQVFTLRRRPEHKDVPITLHMTPGSWNASLIQIWPTRPAIRWPPSVTFDGRGLHHLSARFSRRAG